MNNQDVEYIEQEENDHLMGLATIKVVKMYLKRLSGNHPWMKYAHNNPTRSTKSSYPCPTPWISSPTKSD